MVSHQLRTPLANIIGIARLLKDSKLDAEQRQQLELLLDCADGLLTRVSDILEYTRAELGEIRLAPSDFLVGEAVADCARRMQEKADADDVKLEWDIDPALPPVMRGDPERLRQVANRLISNAIRRSPGGKVLIRAKTEPQSPAGQTAILARHIGEEPVDESADEAPFNGEIRAMRFSVTDWGPPISEDILDRLFTPFESVIDSGSDQAGSITPGLGICRHIVEMMGGRIWAESSAGQGTTFCFTALFGVVETTHEAQTASGVKP